MKTKTLYLLVSNGGDGSYNICYTFDKAMVDAMEESVDNGGDPEYIPGCDGDGFHYDTMTVPEDATYESLGISEYVHDFDDQ